MNRAGPHPIIEILSDQASPVLVVVDRRLVLGREGCDFVLSDATVSRRHLAVSPAATGCVVEDLGSSNGSTRNGEVLTGPKDLGPTDVVRLGSTSVRLSDLVARPGGTADRSLTGQADARGAAQATAVHSGGSEVLRRPASAAVDDAGFRGTSIGVLADAIDDDASLRVRAAESVGPAGTLTFLFSDIESSTQLAQSMGDQRWYQVVKAHDDLIASEVRHVGGTIVKSLGDGHLCTFGTARAGLQAAVAIQAGLVRGDHEGIAVRMGLHTGEALAVDGDVFGLHVNVAARIAARAAGGQVLVSSLTRAIVQTSGDWRFGAEEMVELKGIAEPYGVSELVLSDPVA